MALSETQREWEQRLRLPAAVAAVLAGVLTLVGAFLLTTLPEEPSVGVLQALSPALSGELDGDANPRAVFIEWNDDNLPALLLSAVVSSLGMLCMAVALYYLYRATDARKENTPRVARYAVFFGPVTAAVAGVLLFVIVGIQADDLVSGDDRSRAAVDEALGGGVIPVALGFRYAGQLASAVAVVLIALHAMRAGLLTRFMGILGIIVGALFVIQFGSLPLVQAVWLIALAPLFLRRWPGGNPPAWERGEAVPWPSQQELREARMRAAEQRGGGGAPEITVGDDDAADPAPAPKPHPSSKKRKRRR